MGFVLGVLVFVLFFTSGKLVWGVLACSMCADSVCARSVGKCRCPAVGCSCGSGQGQCRRWSRIVPLPPSHFKAYPRHCSSPALWTRTFICTPPLCWVTTFIASAGLPGCSGDRFAGGREAGWGSVCPRNPEQPGLCVSLSPAGWGRRRCRAVPPGEQLRLPPLPCPARPGCAVPELPLSPPFGPRRWDSTACT